MNFDNLSTLIMSDSLKDKILPSDLDISKYEDSFVIVALVVKDNQPLIGSLSALSIENDIVKIDFRVAISAAHEFVGLFMQDKNVDIEMVEMHYQTIHQMTGNFCVTSVKILEIDHTNKLATIALDLVKTQ